MCALSIFFLYERLVTNMPSFNFNNSARKLYMLLNQKFNPRKAGLIFGSVAMVQSYNAVVWFDNE